MIYQVSIQHSCVYQIGLPTYFNHSAVRRIHKYILRDAIDHHLLIPDID